jgi:hypothetical protein
MSDSPQIHVAPLGAISAEERRALFRLLTQPARERFLNKFNSTEERQAHFSDMGKRSGAVRRARALAKKAVGDA